MEGVNGYEGASRFACRVQGCLVGRGAPVLRGPGRAPTRQRQRRGVACRLVAVRVAPFRSRGARQLRLLVRHLGSCTRSGPAEVRDPDWPARSRAARPSPTAARRARLRTARPRDNDSQVSQPDGALRRGQRSLVRRPLRADHTMGQGQRGDDGDVGRQREDSFAAAAFPRVQRPSGTRAGIQASRAALHRAA